MSFYMICDDDLRSPAGFFDGKADHVRMASAAGAGKPRMDRDDIVLFLRYDISRTVDQMHVNMGGWQDGGADALTN